MLAPTGCGRLEDRRKQRFGRADMDLPEDAGRHAEHLVTHLDVDGARPALDAAPHDESDLGRQLGQTRRGPPMRGDHHDRLGPGGRGSRSRPRAPTPGPRGGQGARGRHGRGGHGALVDPLDPMGAVTPEADVAATVHRHPHPAAPAEPGRVPGDRLHHDRALQPGDAGELFLDPRRLEPPLRPEFHVLVVTAPAAARTGVRAGGSTRSGEGCTIRTASARR